MLVRRDALAAAGGIAAIRGALIDDCALAALLKARGPIRLSLAERVTSLRRYPDFGEIRRMVVRSAYAQLNYSPALLVFTRSGDGAGVPGAACGGGVRARRRPAPAGSAPGR